MYERDESLKMAQRFIDNVLDAEEALNEGELEEALQTLAELKSQMMFLISVNQYESNPLLININPNKIMH